MPMLSPIYNGPKPSSGIRSTPGRRGGRIMQEFIAVEDSVDLYNSHYDRVNDEVYQSIRLATYGEDLGQASWITSIECGQFCTWLGIRSEHRLLEVACGSGGVSVHIAATTGAEVVGVDINPFA